MAYRHPSLHALLLGLLLACALAGAASAHPHVWITVKADIVFSDGAVTAVRHRWTFDAAYSAYAIQGLGSSDGTLGREQLQQLAKVNTESLHEFGYFTALKVNDQAQAFGPPRDATMVLDNGQLTLAFMLPLQVPAPPGPVSSFDFDDPTFFVSFMLAEGDDALRLTGAPASCMTTVTRPTPPPPGGTFSEAFFQALATQSSFGADYAIKAVVTCP